MRSVYLILAIAGALVPYIFFARFIGSPDPTLDNFVRELFATAPASGFTADLLITSIAFWVWSYRESARLGMARWWGYVAVNLAIGLSCALPLFLFNREAKVASGSDRKHSSI